MTEQVRKAQKIRQGDTFSYPIRRAFSGGRLRRNATIRFGESTVSCPDVRFVAGDEDHECFGTGIPTGTTIVSVAADGKSATLSNAATATALGSGLLIVRSRNLSDYTFAAQLRRTKLSSSPLVDYTVDTTNAAGGEIILRLTSTQTALLTGTGVWDFQATLGGEPDTWLEGRAVVIRDVTR
jgi:hypothetical protein